MNEISTRRGFLGLAAALAAAGCGGSKPVSPAAATPAPPAPARAVTLADKGVAMYFLNNATNFEPDIPQKSTFAAINLYGLGMLDTSEDQLLLPATGLKLPDGSDIELHQPRLWANTPSTGLASTGHEGDMHWWDLRSKEVRFEWTTDTANLTETSDIEIEEAEHRHPWRTKNMLVRLCSLAGTSLIKVADRKDDARVALLVQLGKGKLIPGAPWSAAGAVSEWQFRKGHDPQAADVGNTTALTDNATLLRAAPAAATKLKVVITGFATGSTSEYIEFDLKNAKPLRLALTHAVHQAGTGTPDTILHHMTAFALLTKLADANYTSFPVAHFVRGIHGESAPPVGSVSLSDEDGHCPLVQE